jgi:hypothetical protein
VLTADQPHQLRQAVPGVGLVRHPGLDLARDIAVRVVRQQIAVEAGQPVARPGLRDSCRLAYIGGSPSPISSPCPSSWEVC